MSVRVEPEGLASAGVVLAGAQMSGVAPVALPAGADAVSVDAAAQLNAQSAALAVVVGHAGVLRGVGGAAVQFTAAGLVRQDDGNAARIGGGGTGPTPGTVAVLAPAATPGAPPIPSMPPPLAAPALPGDAQAVALHGGQGPASLRLFAQQWDANAAEMESLADRTRRASMAIAESWVDGHQRAAVNTSEHGAWLRTAAQQARTLAAAAAGQADAFDTAKAATPSPAEFADMRRALLAAHARRDAVGVANLSAQYARLQAEAVDAGVQYQADTSANTRAMGAPLQHAPAITRGAGIVEAAANHVPLSSPNPADMVPNGGQSDWSINCVASAFGGWDCEFLIGGGTYVETFHVPGD